MLPESVRVLELLRAQVTGEVPLVGVLGEVLQQVLLVGETFGAVGAAVAVLALVDQQMALQVPHAGAGLGTHRANQGLEHKKQLLKPVLTE